MGREKFRDRVFLNLLFAGGTFGRSCANGNYLRLTANRAIKERACRIDFQARGTPAKHLVRRRISLANEIDPEAVIQGGSVI